MARARPVATDPGRFPTPSFVVDLGALEENLQVLAAVQEAAGCKILLALKGFAMWATFPLVGRYLHGIAASSPFEARLGREHMNKEVHTYAPAFDEASVLEVAELSDHVVFNSPRQLARFGEMARAAGCQVGLRMNPEHSEVEVALYDPCAPGSRLGTTAAALEGANLSGLDGLHFHTLCELGSDALERTVAAVEQNFGELLGRVRWVNMGGGHHITKPGYDRDRLIKLVRGFRERHGVEVFLEPGEAIAVDTGVLVASVLDLTKNGNVDIAVVDVSATAHMPDTLEMPYRPDIRGAGKPGEQAHTYRLGGQTCLAGDVIGDYSFARPLAVGDRLIFEDMAHYTMVKTSMFNGVAHPALATYDPASDTVNVVREFGYADYAARLG